MYLNIFGEHKNIIPTILAEPELGVICPKYLESGSLINDMCSSIISCL